MIRREGSQPAYAWIVERARSGEPVPIDTTRPDMQSILDWLTKIDGNGLLMQLDNEHNLLWVSRKEPDHDG